MRISDLLTNIEQSKSKVVVYGFGIAGRWVSSILAERGLLIGIVDTDSKRWGNTFCGTVISGPESLSNLQHISFDVVNTVIDVQDVTDTLNRVLKNDGIALGLYLDDLSEPGFFTKFPNSTVESDEFLRYGLEAVKRCHEGYYSDTELFLRSVDIVITEKCSLKCKDCSNLMQYYENPQNVSFDDVCAQLNQLLARIDHLFEVRLIGGEPFMNKDIYKFIDYLIPIEKISRIIVYSNATIPIDMDKRETLAHNKVVFSLTDYGTLAKNTPRVISQLEGIGAAHRLHPPDNWTDSGVIHDFKRTKDDMKRLFNDCCGKNLLTLSNSRIYRCPFAANADRLSAIPNDGRNSVSVDSSAREIKKYISEIDYLPACNYCKGRSFNSPSILPAVQTKTPLSYVKFM